MVQRIIDNGNGFGGAWRDKRFKLVSPKCGSHQTQSSAKNTRLIHEGAEHAISKTFYFAQNIAMHPRSLQYVPHEKMTSFQAEAAQTATKQKVNYPGYRWSALKGAHS